MRTSGADGSASAAEHLRRRAIRRRLAVVVVVVVAVMEMQSPAPAQVGGPAQARVCAALQGVLASYPNSAIVRQALAPYLARYGCGPAQPGTTAASTTTSVHLDCMLPGGGIGACPTTTFTTLAPTTLPPGVTTVPPPTTTLPPCSSTTVTSALGTSTTTPMCQP